MDRCSSKWGFGGLLCAVLMLTGCGTRHLKLSSYDFQFDSRKHVPIYGGNMDGIAGDAEVVTARKVIFVRGGWLYINGWNYGRVDPGSSIKLEGGGVIVDGLRRPGRKLTGDDRRRLRLKDEFNGAIGSLEITIRPGIPAIGFAKGNFHFGDKATYVFGMTPVTLSESGGLWIRGARYVDPRGLKTIWDAKRLVIDGRRVEVDGEKWSPSVKAN